MKLLETLGREDPSGRNIILIALTLSGSANAALLVIINAASGTVVAATPPWQLAVYFSIALTLYVLPLRRAAHDITTIFETVINSMRSRLTRRICDAELATVERLGQGNIYNLLAQETNVISETKNQFLWAGHAAVLVLITFAYLAYLSLGVFVVCVVLALTGAITFYKREQAALPSLNLAIRKQEELVDHIGELLEGFGDLKINDHRREGVYAEFLRIANEQRQAVITSDTISFNNSMYSKYFFLVALGVNVFLLVMLFPGAIQDTSDVATTVIFAMAPIGVIMSALPEIMRANLAAENIEAFENTLEKIGELSEEPETLRTPPDEGFTELTLHNAQFSYVGAHKQRLFTVGPLDLTVRSGEIVFLVGGNGSGKSTVLKMLTALYFLDEGEITLDGEVITRAKAQDYRQRFSVILSDFHIFQTLHGLRDVQQARVDELLRMMRLENKTAFVDGRFTSLDLSTGQRKRLAMVVALLDDRPIYVLDEWAADQDPEFRTYFYEVMLKDLRRHGKTIIAASHDDRFFHVADRVLKMDYGGIVEEI